MVFVKTTVLISASYLPFYSFQVAPCVNNTKVDFSWIVTCTEASAKQKVEDSASFQATKNQATLKVSQGVLTPGVTCTFNVTGSMNYDPSVKSSVTQNIITMPSPLAPVIFGGKVQSANMLDCSTGYFNSWCPCFLSRALKNVYIRLASFIS